MMSHDSPYVDDDDLELTGGDEVPLPHSSFSDPDEDRRETVRDGGAVKRRGRLLRYRPAAEQMNWIEAAGYAVAVLGAAAACLAVGYHLGARAPRDPAQALVKSKGHVGHASGGILDASESYGKELTMADIVDAAEEDDVETPADYTFESSIDISGMTQKDKLLLTTLARYDFMRDETARLMEKEYVDMRRSPDVAREDGDFYVLDSALEAMQMYMVDYEPVEIEGHPFMYLGSVGR